MAAAGLEPVNEEYLKLLAKISADAERALHLLQANDIMQIPQGMRFQIAAAAYFIQECLARLEFLLDHR